jgi:hypothetical protein
LKEIPEAASVNPTLLEIDMADMMKGVADTHGDCHYGAAGASGSEGCGFEIDDI